MNKQSTKIISNYLVGVIMSLIRNTDQVCDRLNSCPIRNKHDNFVISMRLLESIS